MKRFAALLAVCAALHAAPAQAGSVSGRLLDPAGKPVAGARVQWVSYRTDDELTLDMSAGVEPRVLGEASTAADGSFRVALDKANVAVGLRVFPPGSPSLRFRGPFDSTEDVSLEDLYASRGVRLSGRVVDEEGKPVSGARVRAAGTEILSDQESMVLSEVKTAADGTFSMVDAPGGIRSIVARAPGFVQASIFQMDPKPDLNVTLKRGARSGAWSSIQAGSRPRGPSWSPKARAWSRTAKGRSASPASSPACGASRLSGRTTSPPGGTTSGSVAARKSTLRCGLPAPRRLRGR